MAVYRHQTGKIDYGNNKPLFYCRFGKVITGTKYSKRIFHLVFIGVIVFSLAPCKVKEYWLSIIQWEYSKPLNRSQTTASGSFCQYSAIDSYHQITNKRQKRDIDSRNSSTSKVLFRRIFSEPIFSAVIIFSGNSPPLYILYRRLKLHV